MTTPLAAVLLAALCADASAASGKLVFAAGKVTVTSGAKSFAGKSGSEVGPGDSVQTGPGALAILQLDDGSSLKLRESTTVTLSGDEKGKGLTEVILKLGSVFSRIRQAKGREFRLRTPAAVAAVRGTEFFTAFGRKKRKGHDLWLCVGTGAVEVASLTGPQKLTVKEGEGILIKGGGSLTTPQAYDWTKTLNWNMDPGKGGVEDKTQLEGAYSDLLDQDYK